MRNLAIRKTRNAPTAGPLYERSIGAAGGFSDVAMAALLVGLGLLLWFAGQSISRRWFSHPGAAAPPQVEQLLGMTASVAGLSILIWWALSFAVAVTAVLLSRTGNARLATKVGRCSPMFLRRLAIVALGANLLSVSAIGPAAASTPLAIAGGVQSVAAVQSEGVSSTEQSGPPVDPMWRPSETHDRSAADPPWTPRRPAPGDPLLLPPTHSSTSGEPDDVGKRVTVLSGDSLWGIAAAHLGPFATDVEIALEWPRWYAANRQLIGDNPDQIYPGQILRAPSAQ